MTSCTHHPVAGMESVIWQVWLKRDARFGSYSPHSVTLRKWWVAVARHLKSKHNKPQFLLNSSIIKRWIITPHVSMSSNAWAFLESSSTDDLTGGEHSLESEPFVWLPVIHFLNVLLEWETLASACWHVIPPRRLKHRSADEVPLSHKCASLQPTIDDDTLEHSTTSAD